MALAGLAAAGCLNSTASNDEGAQRGGRGEAELSRADRMFVDNAVASGRLEVEHARLAAGQALTAAVKDYAGHLLAAHTAANDELMAILHRQGILPPDQSRPEDRRGSIHGNDDATTTTRQGAPATGAPSATGTTGASGTVATTGEALERERTGTTYPWMQASGAAFDVGFLATQVKLHQDAIALFDQHLAIGADAELKAFAQRQLPALRDHLSRAQALQRATR